MNFIKKNFKHLVMGVTLLFFTLMLGLGVGLSAFGMGMDSQRFINSVEKTIDKYIPKGTVVIDGKGNFFGMATGLLKESYATDVLSTLTDEQQNDSVTKKFWEDYADVKFDEDWKAIIDNKEDIDINEFSHALVQFDVAIAEQFHNYAFTHSGLQWIGQSGALSELWSLNFSNTELYQEAKQNQTIINQSEYQSGTYVVNNKVWFINQQIQTLTSSLALPVDIFKDKQSVRNTLMTNEDGQEVAIQISSADLYHPNYTKMFQQTRIGSIFLIILTPIFGVVFIGSSLVGYSVFLKMNWSKNLINKFKNIG